MNAIIFDLWETLGTKNVAVSGVLREKFDIPKTDGFLKEYEEAVQLKEWKTEEDMARGFLEAFDLERSPENVSFVTDTFRSGVERATPFPGMRELLVSLKGKGWRIGLLSNTTVFESDALGRFGMDGLFDAAVFSWQTGVLKPSDESFARALEALGAPKEGTIFVDDGEGNVRAATAFGLRGIVFHGVDALKTALGETEGA